MTTPLVTDTGAVVGHKVKATEAIIIIIIIIIITTEATTVTATTVATLDMDMARDAITVRTT